MDLETLKSAMCAHIDDNAATLLHVSHEIHSHPEENFEEFFAHELLTDTLAAAGLDVHRHAYDLDTAFAARTGSAGPNIAVLLEYDALPVIGHACGHNVIAAAGLGAGLAAAALATEAGGRVTILGTPAEEGGGGKVFMAQRGAFDDVDAAMMVHPADVDLTTMNAVAIHRLDVVYHGVSAHAAAFPWNGVNALDAAVLGYMNVAALRQHIRVNERIHGVFTDGGDKPNIVPARAAMHWYVRSTSSARLRELEVRVLAALEAGALATGCTMEATWLDPAFDDLLDNDLLSALYAANAARLGRVVTAPETGTGIVGSTDMGNVSHLVPSIHPMIALAPPGVGIHTPEFAPHAVSADGDRAVLHGAKAMAMTIADLWCAPSLVEAAAEQFRSAGSR